LLFGYDKINSEVNTHMPSNAVLEAKKAKVEQLTDLIKNSVSGVLVDYKGITVEEDTKLRKELREAGVNYFVEKNTMLLRAFKECGIEGFEEALNGTTALAVSNDDQTAPARILGKYADASEGKFKVKAGYIGSDIYDEAGVMALSKIPSRDVLLAQLVGSLQGPIQKLAALLKAVSEKDGEAA
jgi:large subunit ribosomal protein L10